jgi:cbb3-type cytochrome oxidase subunit 3
VRENIAYLFLIVVLILLIAVTFGVLGKGEYQPPENEDQGYVSRAQL